MQDVDASGTHKNEPLELLPSLLSRNRGRFISRVSTERRNIKKRKVWKNRQAGVIDMSVLNTVPASYCTVLEREDDGQSAISILGNR